MLKVPTHLLQQQMVLSRIVCELVYDRAAREEIKRTIARSQKENNAEHRRISEREVHNMILSSILRENPRLTSSQAQERFERRLAKALEPYAGPIHAPKRGPTAADAHRAVRRAMVKKGHKLRQ